MLNKIAISLAACCLSTAAFAGQTCTQTLVPGSCNAVCTARDDYGSCTNWQFQGCQYKTVCTKNSLTESFNEASLNRLQICDATLSEKDFDIGNADQVGQAFLTLNFPSSFNVKSENGKISLKNNDKGCK